MTISIPKTPEPKVTEKPREETPGESPTPTHEDKDNSKVHLHTTPELRDTAVTRESRLTPHVKPTWSEKSSPEIVELGNKPTWEKQLSLRRGEEYPAYQKENVKEHYGLASPNAERMERPHSSYSLQTSSIKGTFPQKTVGMVQLLVFKPINYQWKVSTVNKVQDTCLIRSSRGYISLLDPLR